MDPRLRSLSGSMSGFQMGNELRGFAGSMNGIQMGNQPVPFLSDQNCVNGPKYENTFLDHSFREFHYLPPDPIPVQVLPIYATSQSSFSSSNSVTYNVDKLVESPNSPLQVPDLYNESQSVWQFRKGVEEARYRGLRGFKPSNGPRSTLHQRVPVTSERVVVLNHILLDLELRWTSTIQLLN
ncbi:hypothetical protein L1049_009284 [Liquidambar formosana]|uniref:Uncharacterized protein n=1 Tax=Liquidambar formosana TaxID=63359 RepID=A0AAP0X698_LIQFO